MKVSISSIMQTISYTSGVFDLLKKVSETTPSFYQLSHSAESIWFWSEAIVLLFNRKKRAIHDYIAKTLVVIEETLPIQYFPD